jgi:hypothetical protein
MHTPAQFDTPADPAPHLMAAGRLPRCRLASAVRQRRACCCSCARPRSWRPRHTPHPGGPARCRCCCCCRAAGAAAALRCRTCRRGQVLLGCCRDWRQEQAAACCVVLTRQTRRPCCCASTGPGCCPCCSFLARPTAGKPAAAPGVPAAAAHTLWGQSAAWAARCWGAADEAVWTLTAQHSARTHTVQVQAQSAGQHGCVKRARPTGRGSGVANVQAHSGSCTATHTLRPGPAVARGRRAAAGR